MIAETSRITAVLIAYGLVALGFVGAAIESWRERRKGSGS